MKFKKLEVLEYRNDYTVYYGMINNKSSILMYNKDLPNEIDINGDITFKNENAYKFNQEGIYTLYYPAEQDFIDSFKCKMKIVSETYEDYKLKIEPYIDTILESNTKWIMNILNNKAETERVLFKNEFFVIVKNICWDNVNDFYLLVLPFEKIKNIRHLDSSHKDLLNNMKIEALKIAKTNNIDNDELYLFFHYHPSCYHMHLHVCLLNHKSLKATLYRHILLDDIVNNIDNYKKKTIKFEVSTSNPIYKLLLTSST